MHSSERIVRRTVTALLLPALVLSAACARMEAPPGGPPDNVPPVVSSTSPDTFAVVEPFDGEVTFRFSERISEQPTDGTLEDAVVVSPETGSVQVDHARQSLDVSIEGGFRPNLVYRVRVLPVVRDMFGNPLVEPFELVFSTGAEFRRGVIGGEVLDRISGEPVAGARIHAVHGDPPEEAGDSVLHVGRTDSDGIFTLRYLPPGPYAVTAFEDQNRNREVDDLEARAERDVRLEGEADTVVLSLEVLAPDTTPPRIVGAQAVDSATIHLETDDVLDPAESLDLVRVSLSRDEGEAPARDTLLHEYEWEARRQALEEAAADAAADEPEADTADDAAPDTADDAPPAADEPQAPPDTVESPYDPGDPPRAEQDLYLLLEEPLDPDVTYTVSVEGLENIAGATGGGGDAEVVYAPPPPDTAEADTADAAPGAPDDVEDDPGDDGDPDDDPGDDGGSDDDAGDDDPGDDGDPDDDAGNGAVPNGGFSSDDGAADDGDPGGPAADAGRARFEAPEAPDASSGDVAAGTGPPGSTRGRAASGAVGASPSTGRAGSGASP